MISINIIFSLPQCLYVLQSVQWYLFLADFSKRGTVPDRMYLINLGFILTLILQITSALVYQFLSMAIKRSKAGVSSDLSESLSFRTYYSIFLILKMINPSMHPVHWLILSGSSSCGGVLCMFECVYTQRTYMYI